MHSSIKGIVAGRCGRTLAASHAILCCSNALQRRPAIRFAIASKKQSTFKGQHLYRTVGSAIDKSDVSFTSSLDMSSAMERQYGQIYNLSKKGGGEKAIERHIKMRKLRVEDRLNRLIDSGSCFLELGATAGMGMPYGDVPSGGLTTGIGQICGHHCMVLINDGTVKGGTIYPITVKKQLRAQEVAMTMGLPCIYLVDSGGAFLPLQAAIFPDKEHGGRVFYNEAVMSAMKLPQISLVCGSCTAGGAYVPTMADESIIVDKIGTIFLGGPPLVKAALGEVVTAEELGGATLHCKTSGYTDYFASSEEEAIQMCRDIVTTLNSRQVEGSKTRSFEEPLYSCDELAGLLPNLSDAALPANLMYQIIARLVDGSRFHEFKFLYGPTLIAGFAHVRGNLVGIIANNGNISAAAAEKGAHFVELCTQRNVPLAFLQNATDSHETSATSSSHDGNVLRSHAKMISAISCSPVPKFTFQLGDSFGFASQMMGSRSMGATLVFAWPNSRTALMEPRIMARLASEELFPEKIESGESQMYAQFNSESSALYGAACLWTDEIVLPRDTRHVLGQCLDIATHCTTAPTMIEKFLRPFYRM